MRIAININFFQKVDRNINHTPRAVGAIAYLLAEELVRRNHDVTVFVTSDSDTSAHIANNAFNSKDEDIQMCADYSIGKLGTKSSPPTQINYEELYQKYLTRGNENIVSQAKNFDIIHTHDWKVEDSLAQYVHRIPIPVVTTLHGATMKYNNIAPNHFFIAISQSQKNLYPNLPITGIAYNGIKMDDFTFSNKAGTYLAYLGRITPEKGTLEAIEAAKRTKRKLLLAGTVDLSYPQYIKQFFAEIDSNSNLRYLGQIGKEEKNELLKNASALLLPIQWDEPFGLVAVESLACGTPVIAYRKGAIPEIVEDSTTGFIVDTIDQMINCIDKVHTLNRKDCRAQVQKHFTIATMTDAYENLYKQIQTSKS